MYSGQRMQGWQMYPVGLPCSVRGIDNVYDLQERLEQNSDSLFIDEPSDANLEVSALAAGISKEYSPEENLTISTITSLEQFLNAGDIAADEKTKFFIISQRNSWARLKISREMFTMLCHFYQVFPKYLESVFKFNTKTCQTEEYFGGACYHRVRRDETHGHDTKSSIFEISYNIRYFEKHGRELPDPWSSRQYAVYQNYSCQKNRSIWILIQTPKQTRDHLARINSQGENVKCSSLGDHPLSLHIFLLFAGEKNWGPYIGYLANELYLMHQDISFPKTFEEYNLNVSHTQQLSHLRQKLENAFSHLETNFDVSTTLLKHADEMRNRAAVSLEMDGYFQSEVQQYRLALRGHIRNVRKHLKFSKDIRHLIFKIMDFRNDDRLQANGNSLKKLASATALENKAMVSIANKTMADSRTMKIATLIATIYLPVSLVTSFFSTSFVQFGSGNAGDAPVTVRKEIWIFIVISLFLMGCTIASAFIWRRRQRDLDLFSITAF